SATPRHRDDVQQGVVKIVRLFRIENANRGASSVDHGVVRFAVGVRVTQQYGICSGARKESMSWNCVGGQDAHGSTRRHRRHPLILGVVLRPKYIDETGE